MQKTKKENNFMWGGLHPFSYHPVIFHFVPDLKDKSVLDCGCGKGIWGYLMRAVRDLDGATLTGVDLDANYLKFCKTHNIYDKLVKASITDLPVKNASTDFLICSEVIEHLTKKDGVKFLKEVDRVMQKGGRAIITTPNMEVDTFIEIGKDAHSSYWTAEDFVKRGYKVRGMGIKIPSGFARWYTPYVLALGYLLTPLTFMLPQTAGFLIAIKDYQEPQTSLTERVLLELSILSSKFLNTFRKRTMSTFEKAKVIRGYKKRYRITNLVETGTFAGDMVEELVEDFDDITSIELKRSLYERAKKRFAKCNNVKIINGDSVEVLRAMLPKITKPTLFWLDAHYSGGRTGKTDLETVVKKELDLILRHPIKKHVILIDDADMFVGTRDYPTIAEVKSMVKKLSKNYSIDYDNAIVKIITK